MFEDQELEKLRGQDDLFAQPARAKKGRKDFDQVPAAASAPVVVISRSPSALDPDQEAIVASGDRRIVVAAGPGPREDPPARFLDHAGGGLVRAAARADTRPDIH